jgi:hypothetical protein
MDHPHGLMRQRGEIKSKSSIIETTRERSSPFAEFEKNLMPTLTDATNNN